MAKNIADLVKLIEKKVKIAMEKEVSEVAKRTLQENVISEVYEQYTPTQYERTGGLYQDRNIEVKMENDSTLSVRSTREEDGRDIASIIEYGVGYSYPGLDERIGARPFHQVTKQELEEKGLAKKALESGLKKQGVNIK